MDRDKTGCVILPSAEILLWSVASIFAGSKLEPGIITQNGLFYTTLASPVGDRSLIYKWGWTAVLLLWSNT